LRGHQVYQIYYQHGLPVESQSMTSRGTIGPGDDFAPW
jgi:hypothetical protein